MPLRRRSVPVSPESLARYGSGFLSDYGRYAFGAGRGQSLPHHALSLPSLPQAPAPRQPAPREDPRTCASRTTWACAASGAPHTGVLAARLLASAIPGSKSRPFRTPVLHFSQHPCVWVAAPIGFLTPQQGQKPAIRLVRPDLRKRRGSRPCPGSIALATRPQYRGAAVYPMPPRRQPTQGCVAEVEGRKPGTAGRELGRMPLTPDRADIHPCVGWRCREARVCAGAPQPPYWAVVSRFSRSPWGCSPWTRNQVFSAMLVAWSPMRSMFLAMNSRWVQDVIWRGSSAM